MANMTVGGASPTLNWGQTKKQQASGGSTGDGGSTPASPTGATSPTESPAAPSDTIVSTPAPTGQVTAAAVPAPEASAAVPTAPTAARALSSLSLLDLYKDAVAASTASVLASRGETKLAEAPKAAGETAQAQKTRAELIAQAAYGLVAQAGMNDKIGSLVQQD